MTLEADNEGPDQSARMRRLIRAYVVRNFQKGPGSFSCVEHKYFPKIVESQRKKACDLTCAIDESAQSDQILRCPHEELLRE